jgi:hypothetical protein
VAFTVRLDLQNPFYLFSSLNIPEAAEGVTDLRTKYGKLGVFTVIDEVLRET